MTINVTAESNRRPTVCFYTGLRDIRDFRKRSWYIDDARIFETLGFRVWISRSLWSVPPGCDLYYAWWPTTGLAPCLVAKATRRPFIVVGGGDAISRDLKDSDPGFGYYRHSLLGRMAIQFTLRNADHVVAVSQYALTNVRDFGVTRCSMSYHCVDSTKYFPLPPARRSDQPYVLTVCAELQSDYVRRKNLISMIKAFAVAVRRHPTLQLKIIGRAGNALPDLRSTIQALNIEESVIFTGSVSESEKISLLQGASAFLQPSRHELFGVAIAEAMRCGTPVIVSRAGSIPEVVGDHGLYVNGSDSDEIATAIETLLADDPLSHQLSIGGFERVRALFSFEARRERMRTVLHGLGFACH